MAVKTPSQVLDQILGWFPTNNRGEITAFRQRNALFELLIETGTTAVNSVGIEDPPVMPMGEDAYVLGPTPTGVWAGQGNKIAYLDLVGAWAFYPADIPIGPIHDGLTVWAKSEDNEYAWDGSIWAAASFGGVASVFGRIGDVVAETGDYTSSQVLNSSQVVGTTVSHALNTLDNDKISAATFTEQVQDIIGSSVVAGTGISVSYSDISGATTIASIITQYTDEMTRDAIGAALVGGTGITITVDDTADTITITGSALYTDEMAQDAVGGIMVDSSTIDVTYNDGVPSISYGVITGSITNTLLANMPAATIKGSVAGGVPADLTTSQVISLVQSGLDNLYVNITGDTMTGPLQVPGGSLGAAGLQIAAANRGFWTDGSGAIIVQTSGNDRARFLQGGGFLIGASATVLLAGAVDPQVQTHGVNASSSAFANYRWSATAGGPFNYLAKSRGATIGTRGAVLSGDDIGSLAFLGDDGVDFQTGARITASALETYVTAGVRGTRLEFHSAAIGASATSMVATLDGTNGYQMGGTSVIDINRIFRPRVYTVATLPAAPASGFIMVSDAFGGGCLAYSDGTNWRRVGDDVVIVSATASSFGVLAKMTGGPDYKLRELVRGTYQRLSDAGLLTKLKGLWVHALPTQADALRNWITPGTRDLAIVGTPTFTANRGFTGNGTDSLLNTGVASTVFGVTPTDLAYGVFIRTASTAAAAVIGSGAIANTRRAYMSSALSGTLTTRLSNTINSTWTPARYTGMFTMTRGASTDYNIYLDDALVTNLVVAGSATNPQPAFLGTTDATGSEFSTAQIAFSFVSLNLSATDVKNLRTIMVDYFLAKVGAFTPTVANLPPADAFKTYIDEDYFLSDLGGAPGSVRSNGVNLRRIREFGYEAIATDTNSTLLSLTNGVDVLDTATLTADRDFTLGHSNQQYPSAFKRITRTGTGAFIRNVKRNDGTLLAKLPTGWTGVFLHDGTNWRLAGVYRSVSDGITESFIVACSDETTALTAGTGKLTFRMPYPFHLLEVRASLTTAQTSGSIFTVDVNEAGTSVLSTKLTIDNTEKTSLTAVALPVISDPLLANDAEISVDIDQIGDGTAKGLKIVLMGSRIT